MDPCHNRRPHARRSFINTPYRVCGEGRLEPELPKQCIAGATGTGEPGCVVAVDHRRARKTGPEHPLVVAKCRKHGGAFTLYPPGFVPYGRSAIVPVDAQGQPIRRGDSSCAEQQEHCAANEGDQAAANEGERAANEGDEAAVAQGERAAADEGDQEPVAGHAGESEELLGAPPVAWELTIFGAVQDGACAQAWPRGAGEPDAVGSWRTQGRRIAAAAELLGLTGDAQDGPLVGPMGISALRQKEATAAYQRAGGYQSRAQAIVGPLAELEKSGARLLDQLLMAGYLAGRWGRPWRWDASRQQLRQVQPQARSP
jgi:hypothetical protein